MSELTSYYYYEDRVITPATHQYRVYHADDADKVIAEKDKEIARLNDKALQYKVLDKEHCRDLNAQERRFALQMAHHKYKRCLAMAKLCNEKWLVHNFAEITTKLGFYDKWEKRWLELAEKFKEAK